MKVSHRLRTACIALLAVASLACFAAPASAHDQLGDNPLRVKPISAQGIHVKPAPTAKAAHYYIESYTEQVWYSRFAGRCGNGTTWWCNWRGGVDCAILTGYHSRRCYFMFNEQTVFSGRTCSIDGRSEHGQPAEWAERCWS